MANLAAMKEDKALAQLVDEHRQIQNQPLHLAVAFEPSDSLGDLVLFEVSENFADNAVSDDKEFMRIWVAQSPEFTVRDAKNFYLLLTNTSEFEAALKEGWPQIDELRDSIRDSRAAAYYKDEVGQRWWNQIGGS